MVHDARARVPLEHFNSYNQESLMSGSIVHRIIKPGLCIAVFGALVAAASPPPVAGEVLPDQLSAGFGENGELTPSAVPIPGTVVKKYDDLDGDDDGAGPRGGANDLCPGAT